MVWIFGRRESEAGAKAAAAGSVAGRASRPAGPAAADRAVPTGPLGDADELREALRSVLRAFGKDAVDTDARSAADHRERCQAWAAHLMGDGSPPASASGEVGVGGLAGVRNFFVAERRHEVEFVTRSIANLRDAVAEFVRTLSRLVEVDTAADREARLQVDRLRAVAERGTPEELRREAVAAAQAFTRVLADRMHQQRDEMRRLAQRISELDSELDEARRKSERDPLTQLLNRGAFEECVKRANMLATVAGQPSCLLLIDLDHFKRVNDDHGHAVGDKALRAVADALTRAFLRKTDFVARYGGEELAVIVRDVAAADGRRFAERALEAVRGAHVTGRRGRLQLTASVGVAASQPGETTERWIERADRALYAAKQAGRDRAVIDGE
jgi:diguanylate cyclase (GGDEF)-like protein